jgi:S1-C subfamily serine protease
VTYLLDEPPLPDPGPPRAHDAEPGAEVDAPQSRTLRARSLARRGLPFVTGAAVTLAIVLAVAALQPKAEPLTRIDVREAVDSALASQPPEPAHGELVYAAIQPSIVAIEASGDNPDSRRDDGTGTGVVITDAGEILTAWHVVSEAVTIEVVFADGTRAGAEVVSVDDENDIAVLAPDTLPAVLVPALLGNPAAMRIGSDAYIVGNPFGLVGSLSTGVVSGLERSFRDPETDVVHAGLIQVDAAVNPGNSGGPLLDRAGRVVGIVIALLNPTDQDVFIGIGLAVPIDVAGGAAGLPPY